MTDRVRLAWVLAWAAAVFAMYTTVVGHRSFLPLYLAEGYLSLFAGMLIVYRLVTLNRDGEVSLGAHVVMLAIAVVAAVVLRGYAPTIGEKNYCAALTWRPGLPPHVFRCTVAPLVFVGLVAGYWVAGWVLMRLARRGE